MKQVSLQITPLPTARITHRTISASGRITLHPSLDPNGNLVYNSIEILGSLLIEEDIRAVPLPDTEEPS